MIKEALQYLIGLGNTRTEEVGGQILSTQPMHVIDEPTCKAIVVHSLSGLVQYLKSEFDGSQTLMIHVEDPTTVNVLTNFTRDRKRNLLVQAKAMIPEFRCDKWYGAEDFNIKPQSVFVTNAHRDDMLKVVGNIKDENVATFGDDGVSQQVTAKTGVATVGSVKVPNPVKLAPYRTFVEVRQPESNFVFRMRSGPECALFESDGGAWKVEAMDTVQQYLQKELDEQIEAGTIVLIA
ncbi:hypothetical protein [Alicyclobacillus fastidiosus]|uniref:Phage protein n=1 Tax=Alicyclobacillus fastidiosus TaxID=392011 RepID=A0ABV5AA17_9BACL|nr:hypothetical protein [Alicyclobacillus fastidiosus]WEH10953.1 hypothetical protein PYS47_06980 [Alicyclobacillus fastidiosus]